MIGKVTLRVEGVNLAKALEQLKANYDIFDVQKVNNTTTNLTIPVNYCNKIIAYFKSKCYNIRVIRFSPMLKFCVFLRKFWGQIVLFALCAVLLCVFSNLSLGISFRQDNNQFNQKITDVLVSGGAMGKMMHSVDVEALEQSILENIPEISLVNISKRGCFLVVNYTTKTEALNVADPQSGAIVAKQSGVVSKVFLVRGTALVDVGAYVTAGQVLIANYFVDKDGNTVECPAEGQVYVYTWQSNTVQFCEDVVEYVPTGQQTTDSTMHFLGSVVQCGNQTVPYQHYVVQTEETYLFKFGIPIKLVTNHYLETTPQRVHYAFETKLDALKMQAKEELLTNIDLTSVLEEKYTISTAGDVHFVTYYVKSENLVT